MFSKNKPGDGNEGSTGAPKPMTTPASAGSTPPPSPASSPVPSTTPKAKPTPSLISSDMVIKGHLKTTGDIQVEGTVEGDIEAHLLTIGESATVKGEVKADDVVVTGRIVGRVRGLKVRLTSTARVEGDIVHKTIAIESGAHFEGSVQRNDDPLKVEVSKGSTAAASAAPKN